VIGIPFCLQDEATDNDKGTTGNTGGEKEPKKEPPVKDDSTGEKDDKDPPAVS